MRQTTPTDEPVGPSLLATAAERCPNCEAPMAADQRYCTECGQRRGQPRLPFMDGRTRPATAVAAAGPARRARMSSSTALIAGICTLLLAMGVGVLIGQSGSDSPSATNSPVVVSVPSAAAAPTAATGAAATAATAGAVAGAAAAKKSQATSASAAAAKKAAPTPKPTAAAKKAPKVVKLGDKCTGKGCTNGKFTGDFFGGG